MSQEVKVRSWRLAPRAQDISWPQLEELNAVTQVIEQRPGLIDPTTVELLIERLAQCSVGQGVVLHGGDCAETFDSSDADHLLATADALAQVSRKIEAASSLPATVIGRIAGQYAKPRSHVWERHGVYAWRGDAVNGRASTPVDRTPNPQRLIRAYDLAAESLQTLDSAGFAPPHLFTSHEALVLEFEEALLRAQSPATRYATSAHMLWIGDRTRQADGAHVQFAKSFVNPVGIKVGPSHRPDEIVSLCRSLNPDNRRGRVVLIARLGRSHIRAVLPRLIAAVERTQTTVTWQCDPMHGNLEVLPDGTRTRRLEAIEEEIDAYMDIHGTLGTWPGGIHLEMCGEAVTECVGAGVEEPSLQTAYRTAMDPRLNLRQSILIADLFGSRLSSGASRKKPWQ